MADRLVNTDLDFATVSRILNLPDGTAPQHPATVAQLEAAIAGLAWKDSVRVATQANLNLTAPGASVDGVTMVAGDRFLARAQTAGADNGIYIWNGAAVAAVRAADAASFPDLEQAVVTVEEGTSAGTTYRQTAVNGTIGVTSVAWVTFGTAAPTASETVAGIAEIATQAETDAGADDARFITPLKLKTSPHAARRYATTFGDGSNTSYDLNHNLGTRDVIATIYLAASPYDEIWCEIEHKDGNTLTVKTNVAPTTNQYRIVVLA